MSQCSKAAQVTVRMPRYFWCLYIKKIKQCYFWTGCMCWVRAAFPMRHLLSYEQLGQVNWIKEDPFWVSIWSENKNTFFVHFEALKNLIFCLHLHPNSFPVCVTSQKAGLAETSGGVLWAPQVDINAQRCQKGRFHFLSSPQPWVSTLFEVSVRSVGASKLCCGVRGCSKARKFGGCCRNTLICYAYINKEVTGWMINDYFTFLLLEGWFLFLYLES